MTTRLKVLVSLLLTVSLTVAVSSSLQAGALSESETIMRMVGIPTAVQEVGCAASATATASVAIPASSVVRLVADGGGIHYGFVTGSGALTIAASVYLPQNLVELTQSPASTSYLACLTRSGVTATASVAIMR